MGIQGVRGRASAFAFTLIRKSWVPMEGVLGAAAPRSRSTSGRFEPQQMLPYRCGPQDRMDASLAVEAA